MNPKTAIDIGRKNLPTVLSAFASGGVALTGWLSYKAAAKTFTNQDEKVSVWDTLKANWKNYIPPVVSGLVTIVCIAGANKIHLCREAAMATAVAFYKARENNFETPVCCKEEKPSDVKPEMSINTKIRIWEPYTKQYFEASQRDILWAELTANKMLHQGGYVTLNDVLRLYSDPNIKMKKIGNKIGWSWDSEMFDEAASYYYAGGWIDMCPQFEDKDGTYRFVMDYGINPTDISDCSVLPVL